jgi:L-lactate dehydrogenase complex protein LldE
LQPQIGEAIVRVLEHVGLNSAFLETQTCCGQPAFNAGLRSEARKMAQHTIQTFGMVNDPIVIPSGSCTAMIRHGYLELFADDPIWLPRAQSLAANTFEFSEFLVDRMGITDIGAQWSGKLAYHPSCHLQRGLGVDRQPRALLANIKGVEIVELPNAEECCGFGGVFSVEHPAISAAMLARKIDHIESSQATTIVTADTGCLLHINGGLNRKQLLRRVMHIAEVLQNVR